MPRLMGPGAIRRRIVPAPVSRILFLAVVSTIAAGVLLDAQVPVSSIGRNQSVVAGVADQFVGDMFKQRQNEAVACTFAVNPDQQLFAYNDYRTVDEALDGQVGTPSPIQRAAKLLNPFKWFQRKRANVEDERASAEAWIGISFTDNGTDFYTGLLPGSPFSPSMPGDDLKAYGFEAASDPVFAATPTHCLLAGIAFTPNGGSAGFVSRFTSSNNAESGPNVHFDWTKVISPGPTGSYFVDKPYIVAGANGKVVAAFVVFDQSDPTKLSSKIMVYQSSDYGETWSAGQVVSQPLTRNQSPWILIDPNNENVAYIGWRVFSAVTGGYTNAIVGRRSSDGGATWQPSVPYPVALLLKAYDVPMTQYPGARPTPRSNAYPTAVIDSQGTISVFIQEYVNPSTGYPLAPWASVSTGIARITQTNSSNGGVTWTLRRAFDYGPGSGPQFMPTAAVTGVPGPRCGSSAAPRSRLAVMYYDARASYPNGAVFYGGGGARFDVRIAQADPCVKDSGGRPRFGPSNLVSRYTLSGAPNHPIVTTPGYGFPAVNAAYRIFNSARSAFSGDYIHLAPKIQYVLTSAGWKATTATSVSPSLLPAPVFKGVWADTRDIVLPTDPPPTGAPTDPGFVDALPWQNYLPPHSGIVPSACQNGGSRDQNPYAAEISDGLYAAAPVTFRDTTVPRTFPLYVENRTSVRRYFRLTIDPSPTIAASFNIPTPGFTPDKQADVAIGAFSTVTGSVIVGAGFVAPVRVAIQEIDNIGAGLTVGGLATLVTINTSGDSTGSTDQTELRVPAVDPTPTVTKPFGQIGPGGIIIGPSGPNPYPSPFADNPFADNPFADNPFGDNPFGDNPFADNPFADNTAVYDVTDVSFTATNVGNRSAAFSAILNVLNSQTLKNNGYVFQTLINRISLTPALNGCQTIEQHNPNQVSTIKTPFADNPFADNPFADNPFADNPFADNPFADNAPPGDPTLDPAASNSTFYLAPSASQTQSAQAGLASLVAASAPTFTAPRPADEVTYTLRVYQTAPNPAVTFNPNQVTVLVAAQTPSLIRLPDSSCSTPPCYGFNPGGRSVANAGAAVANKLGFAVQPTTTVAGQPIPTVVVNVLDVFGNPVNSYSGPVSLTIGTNPGGGTLGGSGTQNGTATVNAVEGTATFAGLTILTAGNGYTLIASAPGLTAATSNPFDILPAAPTRLVFGVQPTTIVTAGQAFSPAVSVNVLDGYGNKAVAYSGMVSLNIPNRGEGSAITVAASEGTATFTNLAITIAGSGFTLIASAEGLASATSIPFNVLPAAPSNLAFAVQPTTTTAGQTIAPSVLVNVLDVFGNQVTSYSGPVSLTIGANPANGTLGGTTTVNAVAGTATFSDLTISSAGTGYTLVASSPGLASATSQTFDVSPPVFLQGSLTDPTGDAGGGPDLVSGLVTIDGSNITLSVRFAPQSFNAQSGVVQFLFDTDRNPATGHPGSNSGCEADASIIGSEYILDMGASHGSQAVISQYLGTCNQFGNTVLTASDSVQYVTDGMDITFPAALIGNPTGGLNFKVISFTFLGNGYSGVQDYMSDLGQPAGTTLPPVVIGMLRPVARERVVEPGSIAETRRMAFASNQMR